MPLSPAACQFPKAKEVLLKAEQSWLKNTEVCELLLNYVAYNLPVSKEPPHQPPGALHELCLPGMSAQAKDVCPVWRLERIMVQTCTRMRRWHRLPV